MVLPLTNDFIGFTPSNSDRHKNLKDRYAACLQV